VIQIGIFPTVFARPTLQETLDAVAAHHIRTVEFNMTCAGTASMPEQIEPAVALQIREAHTQRGIAMAAVSGMYNTIDPDEQRRRDGLRRLRVLAAACAALGTGVVTVTTGTRNPDNLWRWHAENDSPEAWRGDLLSVMEDAVRTAEDAGVILAFEPEVNHVVHSARRARRLLDEVRSTRLKVLLDGANLFHTGELPRMREILDEAVNLLGPDIVLAHAKDLTKDGEAGHEAAGHGLLDYDRYISLLQALGRDIPLVLHGLRAEQVDGCVAFLQTKGARLPAAQEA
jgi:sugar phosphate isomerase/epimerase